MLRNALALIAGLALSLAMVALTGWAELHLTEAGEVVQDLAASGRSTAAAGRESGRVFEVLAQSLLRSRVLYRPLIVAMVGLLVGLISRKDRRLIAALAVAPFLALVVAQESWDWVGFALSAVYLFLGMLAAGIAGRRKTPAHQT